MNQQKLGNYPIVSDLSVDPYTTQRVRTSTGISYECPLVGVERELPFIAAKAGIFNCSENSKGITATEGNIWFRGASNSRITSLQGLVYASGQVRNCNITSKYGIEIAASDSNMSENCSTLTVLSPLSERERSQTLNNFKKYIARLDAVKRLETRNLKSLGLSEGQIRVIMQNPQNLERVIANLRTQGVSSILKANQASTFQKLYNKHKEISDKLVGLNKAHFIPEYGCIIVREFLRKGTKIIMGDEKRVHKRTVLETDLKVKEPSSQDYTPAYAIFSNGSGIAFKEIQEKARPSLEEKVNSLYTPI